MASYSPVLTANTINPAYKRINYSIRGPLATRAQEIEQELAEVIYIYIYINFLQNPSGTLCKW